jgi:hypothetical protein
VAATFGLVALVAGCGGSTTKATPLGSSGGAVTTTTVGSTSVPSSGSTVPAHAANAKPSSTPTTRAASSAKGGTGTQPTTLQLAAVNDDLNQAGSALSGSQSAITASNVNTAKGQEGSAP